MLFKGKVLTSLHIGTGKKITPFEYVVENDKFLRINYKKFYDLLEEDKRKNLLKALKSSSLLYARYYVSLYFSSLPDKEKLIIYKIDVSEQFKKIYNIKIGDKKKHNEANRLEIDEMTKNLDGFYIPGSSIKGAIRTLILYDLAKKGGRKELEKFYEIFGDIKNIEDNKEKIKQIRLRSRSDTNDKIEADLIGYNFKNKYEDPFRFLIIRDSSVIDFKNGIVEKNYRLGQKGKLHTTKEYLKKETSFEIELKINNRLFKLSKDKLNLDWNVDFLNEKNFFSYIKQISDAFYKEIFDLIQNFAKKQLEVLKSKKLNRGIKAEIQMYEKLLQNIEKLQNELNNLKDYEILLSLGFGGGYWFKKLDDLLQPKTYNFVGNEMLNGFIKLTFK